LASTDNLTRTTKRKNTYKHKLTLTQKAALTKQQKTHSKNPMLRDRTDRASLGHLLHLARKCIWSIL